MKIRCGAAAVATLCLVIDGRVLRAADDATLLRVSFATTLDATERLWRHIENQSPLGAQAVC
jgi:hypothetical protein